MLYVYLNSLGVTFFPRINTPIYHQNSNAVHSSAPFIHYENPLKTALDQAWLHSELYAYAIFSTSLRTKQLCEYFAFHIILSHLAPNTFLYGLGLCSLNCLNFAVIGAVAVNIVFILLINLHLVDIWIWRSLDVL